MKLNRLKYMVASLLILPMATSCLDEEFPTSGATADQIANGDKATLSRAIVSYMSNILIESGDYTNIGYAGLMVWRDVMSGDYTLHDDATYNYFTYYPENQYIGDYVYQMHFWDFHYQLIQKANLLIGVTDPDNEEDFADYGNALVYRAMTYLDLARWYEFKHTGVDWLDAEASSLGVYKLTVPIVTEKTSETEARNNPRAPFYTMYRFINDDLNEAERVLSHIRDVATKNYASLGTLYGMKARFWLEVATRFTIYPEDLASQLEHETDVALAGYDVLGVNTVADCYRLAADYARKAINQGYTPVTKSEWYNTKTGFNSANNAWMFAIVLGSDDTSVKSSGYRFYSWPAFLAPETSWGIANYRYGSGRCIDARLFSRIPDSDWRKLTWIDPADVNSESAFNGKYAANTTLSYANWKKTGEYVGFKFRPGSGDGETYTVGNLVDIPLMRVEEMYFIEAEAKARVEGVSAGKSLLESFMNTYRYSDGSYSSTATDINGLIDDILTQKRIEFWGEGIIAWDYKRLEKAIVRGYTGTNHYPLSRRNSKDGYVAPWLNMYITSFEYNMNTAVIRNPDPSDAIPQWSE